MPGADTRLSAVLSIAAYVICVVPLWWLMVRVPRAALPDMDSLQGKVTRLATTLPVSITAYVVCQGSHCLDFESMTRYAEDLGRAIEREAVLDEDHAPIGVTVAQESPSGFMQASWLSAGAPRGLLSAGGATSCKDLLKAWKRVVAMDDRTFDAHFSELIAANGHDRPGLYHIFIVPDPWLAADGPVRSAVGRNRLVTVRYSQARGPHYPAVVAQAAVTAAHAFASKLGGDADDQGGDADSDERLPISAASQLHLSFTLLNAHPAPVTPEDLAPHQHAPPSPSARRAAATGAGGNGPGAAAGTDPEAEEEEAGRGPEAASFEGGALVWDFAPFEGQYITPLKELLDGAVRVTVSSQVRYFAPARINATWSAARGAYVVRAQQLPFFLDSSAWGLDASMAALSSGNLFDYDSHPVVAATRAITIGEVMLQRGMDPAVAASRPPPLLLPPPAGEHLPPAVLHLVLYVPPSWQRPLVLEAPQGGGTLARSNSFRVPGWGAVQVLRGPVGTAPVSGVSSEALTSFAVESIGQLRALLGLAAPRQALLSLDPSRMSANNRTAGAGAGGGASRGGGGAIDRASLGPVMVLTALRTGLAPWEVDALVRQRVSVDLQQAAVTLGSLSRLLRALPNLAVPERVGARVIEAVRAIERGLAMVAAGGYAPASRAAQEARAAAEAAFGDPRVSAQLNVPDAHYVGVYLPFCLPAVVPLLQALVVELRRRWQARQRGGTSGSKGSKAKGKGGDGVVGGDIAGGGADVDGAAAGPSTPRTPSLVRM